MFSINLVGGFLTLVEWRVGILSFSFTLMSELVVYALSFSTVDFSRFELHVGNASNSMSISDCVLLYCSGLLSIFSC